MSARGVSGLGVGLVAAGAVLIYSGLENVTVAAVLQDVLHGQKPTPGPPGDYVTGQTGTTGQTIPQTGSAADRLQGVLGLVPFAGAQGADVNGDTISSPANNRNLGRLMAGAYGWATGQEWQALDYGWGTLESGWNNRIYYGGQIGGTYQPGLAYGIPAFLGHGPDGAPYPAGSPANPPGAGGHSSPVSQISQGLAYIKGKYGSPSQVPGWLGQPGYQGY